MHNMLTQKAAAVKPRPILLCLVRSKVGITFAKSALRLERLGTVRASSLRSTHKGSDMEVPVIDISAFASGTLFERTSIARDWARAFQTIGFATIVGHGIDDSLMQNFYDAARRFFDLPMDAKKQCSFPGEQQSQGYVPPDMETIGATFGETNPPDLCQSISFARLDWEFADVGYSVRAR